MSELHSKDVNKKIYIIKDDPTIAKGNCKSMNKEMDGKITSEVKGTGEETAATAKELKATKTVIFILLILLLLNTKRKAYEESQTKVLYSRTSITLV